MENKLPECMQAYPTIFAVGENYNIFIPFSAEVLVKIRVAGKIYYDDCCGILRSNTNMHKVEIPMSALNEARSYTVIYRKMIERKPYFPTGEEEQEIDFDFRPVPNSGKINVYHVSDAHNLVKEPVNAGRFFGDEIDLLVLNGDIPNHSGDVKNFNAIWENVPRYSQEEITIPAVSTRKICQHTFRYITAKPTIPSEWDAFGALFSIAGKIKRTAASSTAARYASTNSVCVKQILSVRLSKMQKRNIWLRV